MVLEDFKRALGRTQSDYAFYIECQMNPDVALAGYDLSPDERSALTDPEKLTDALNPGVGVLNLRPITVKISGKHDWVNRSAPKKTAMSEVDREARLVTEVKAIKQARRSEERTGAVIRLMEQLG